MSKKTEVDFDVAQIIELVGMVNTIHVMPLTGGLLDQDSLFMHLYKYTNKVIDARQEMDDKVSKANTRATQGRRR